MKKKILHKHRISIFGMLFHKPLFFLFLLFFLPFLIWGTQQTQKVTSFGKNLNKLIIPLQSSVDCPSSSSNSYGSIDPLQGYPAGDPAAENHPDLNPVAILGYITSNGEKFPLVLGEGGDPKAPQIGKMLNSRPTIVSLYRLYSWDWANKRKGPLQPVPNDPAASVKQIQMIGIQTSPGESIKLPPVYGNPISPEYNAMVLFASENFITVKYTREDNIGIKNGYAIQIDGICVDPKLLGLYNQLNGSGRRNLPALSNGQELGTGKNTEMRVVIRDTGDFLDPRSKLDWWQGVDYPAVPTEAVQIPTSIPPTQPIIIQPSSPPLTQSTISLPAPTGINYLVPTTYYQPSTNNPLPTRSPLPTILSPLSTPVPASAPFIDIEKSVNNAKSVWNKIVTNVIKFTLIILP